MKYAYAIKRNKCKRENICIFCIIITFKMFRYYLEILKPYSCIFTDYLVKYLNSLIIIQYQKKKMI